MEELPNALGERPLRKKFLWGVFIFINLLLWIFFGYYIAVNTLLKDKALVRAQAFVAGTSTGNQTTSLAIELNGQYKQVPISSINFKVDNSPVYEYGKGADIFSVWSAALTNIQNSVEVVPDLDLNPSLLLKEFGINLTEDTGKAARWQGDLLVGCEGNQYAWLIDKSKLINSLVSQNGQPVLKLSLDEFVSADRPTLQFTLCSQHASEIDSKLAQVNEGVGGVWLTNKELVLDIEGNWRFINVDSARDRLSVIANTSAKPAQMGEYKEKDGAIWLLSPYQAGQQLNVEKTFERFQSWLAGEKPEFIAEYENTFPEILGAGKKVYDFTNVVAAGRTRVDIVRGGSLNPYLKYAQYGIEAMQDVIIPTQAEFSYIDTIKPQPRGRMANGLPIGGGICNATTTVYRAALEAGFKITARSPHGFYVPSYEWGYPMNIVDAAYYTNPKVDLKFINDYDYPVLLQTEIKRESDGWQYHTILVRTSAQQEKRKVEFKDWKKYNVYSSTRFTGEFTRVVSNPNGEIIREDKFISRYYR